jgi:RNA polymerase sigma-70 factor (ECF subfamily)
MDLTDPTTFAAAFDRHQPSVQATAYRVLGDVALAQDVVQDVFLRVWRNPGKFDGSRGELGGYLRMMARSRAVDLWREGQAAGRASDRLKVVVARDQDRVEAVRPDRVVENRAEGAVVRAALGRLPDSQREALVLSYWGGLTAEQVARRVGVPLGTAKSRIRLGLQRLRDELEGRNDAAAVAA